MVQEGGVRGRSSGGGEVVIVLCFLNKHSLLVLVAACLAIERKKATDKQDPRSH